MTDGPIPNAETSVVRELEPKEIVDSNKECKERLEATFTLAGFPIAVGIIKDKGKFGMDQASFCEVGDKSTWTIDISRDRSFPSRLTLKSLHSSARNPSAFIDETIEIDDPPERPGIGIRRSIIGEPQSVSYDKPTTVAFVEKAIDRIGKQLINPKMKQRLEGPK